ncbi:MAG: ferric reductase-like transmembrane domain-containing protein [Pseudomonadota bacterium]
MIPAPRRNRPYLFWIILSLPAIAMVAAALAGIRFAYNNVTGMVAGVFLAATLFVTPLLRLLGPVAWLRGNVRRHLGVASFVYSLLHLAAWLARATLEDVLYSFLRPEIVTGWIALAIMFPLALTSTDRSVRRMGPGWKALHRWVYLAALLTLAHWYLAGVWIRTMVAMSVPLVALGLWRLWRFQARATR